MVGSGGQPRLAPPAARALAFYLPQYHPIPENDEWWGDGFTEWVNVAAARPLFPGHYQPHVPGELGYYDLRIPEVRAAQAELARDHGLSGFIYYHYWFHGRRLLERPFEEVLASGEPDFPFALCWANEPWTRNWDSESGRLLMPQAFSHQDDLDHIRWLAGAFADRRHLTVDGRPLFFVYRPALLPDAHRTTDTWRAELQRLGLPDPYLVWVDSRERPVGGPTAFGFDATAGFMPSPNDRLFVPTEGVRGHRVVDYHAAYEDHLRRQSPEWRHLPSVMVGWDNTARRTQGATVYVGATPDAYGQWLARTVELLTHVPEDERLLVILAWNEWAEGNHLEPDRRFGRSFLEATRDVILGPPAQGGTGTRQVGAASAPPARSPWSPIAATEAINVVGLLGALGLEPNGMVVTLGPPSSPVHGHLEARGFGTHVVTADPEDAARLAAEGSATTAWTTDEVVALTSTLDGLGAVSALVLLDTLGTSAHPHELLAGLSTWSLAHGDVPLVASVPNVARFDRGLDLLCGEWPGGPVEGPPGEQLHRFTGASFRRLVESCGWRIAARDDVAVIQADRFDGGVSDEIPEELVGALALLAQIHNPDWATDRFVWALTPVAVDKPPASFAEAVAVDAKATDPEYGNADDTGADADQRYRILRDYLLSVGLVASETSRRAVVLRHQPKPKWKRQLLRTVQATPTTARAYTQLRRWLG
jgi:hypothetical protein